MKYSGGKSLLDDYIIEAVRKKREAAKISQAELSAMLDLNDKYIGAVEGKTVDTKYNLNHLNRIAELLHCSIADFLPFPYLRGNYVRPSKNRKKQDKSQK